VKRPSRAPKVRKMNLSPQASVTRGRWSESANHINIFFNTRILGQIYPDGLKR
jgi:hypothetical protein